LGNQPWNYAGRQIGGGDNGGVHTNSGISNYAFYIIAKGGCGYFCLTSYPNGINADAARWIFWRAERVYMGPNDGFAELRQKTIWAAGDGYGYGGPVWTQVRDAWNAVGVPKMCTFWFFGSCLSYGD
jgi:thermolysin